MVDQQAPTQVSVETGIYRSRPLINAEQNIFTSQEVPQALRSVVRRRMGKR